MWRISYIAIVGILLLTSDPPAEYKGTKEIRRADKTIKREWHLTLKRNTECVYTITDITTIKNMPPRYDTTVYLGQWRFDYDTVFVYTFACKKQDQNPLKYLKRGKYLYSLGACVDSLENGRIEKLKQFIRK